MASALSWLEPEDVVSVYVTIMSVFAPSSMFRVDILAFGGETSISSIAADIRDGKSSPGWYLPIPVCTSRREGTTEARGGGDEGGRRSPGDRSRGRLIPPPKLSRRSVGELRL